MEKFGEEFRNFESLGIKKISIPVDKRYKSGLGPLYKKEPRRQPVSYRGPSRSDIRNTIENYSDDITVEVAPTARVYQIPLNQEGLDKSMKMTFSKFNYFVVELGLNIALGNKFRIPELDFKVNLKSDSKNKEDVVAYDIAPKDEIKHTEIVNGKVKLYLDKLLKFAFGPIGQVIPDVSLIKLSWEFKWGYDRYEIDVSGPMNYRVHWKIYKTKTVQSFQPAMILRARKNINEISAVGKCKYDLKSGLFGPKTPGIETPEKSIKVWP